MLTKQFYKQALKLLICLTSFLVFSKAYAYPSAPLNPEYLVEWQVEGELKANFDSENYAYYFTWTQIQNLSTLELRTGSMVGQVIAKLSMDGNERVANEEFTIQEDSNKKATQLLYALQKNNLYSPLNFWLRGLEADENAKIIKQKEGLILEMQEKDWQLFFSQKRVEYNHYPLPQKVSLKQNKNKIVFNILRAETGYLSKVCTDNSLIETDMTNPKATPSEATFPKWIDYQSFCKQLALVQKQTLDSKQGLFGPGSMMWELNRYVVPASFGAGRGLVLQIAHPWVTAAIDEHSLVRDDIVERARHTFTLVYTIIYGSQPQAFAAANKIHRIHEHVQGQMPYDTKHFDKGSEYRANNIEALMWVHATLWDTLVLTFETIERKLSPAEKARFYEETKLFAMMFGIPQSALPADWQAFEKYNKAMWKKLEATEASKALAEDLFHPNNFLLMFLMPIQKTFAAATLPPEVGKAYDLENGFLGNSFYWAASTSAKIGDRFLIPPLRYNPVYREAMARTKGKRSSAFTRSELKLGVGRSVLVN